MKLWVLLALAAIGSGASAENSFNCSYNGKLVGTACECAPEWKGKFCHQLNLAPARNGSGLDQLHAEPFTSTWGGSVIFNKDDGLWHMYASEISKHCGIHRWVTNSIVVHATSRGGPEWHFERKSEVRGLFTHEPIVARAPTGEFVVYVTAYDGTPSDCPTCNCTNGQSDSGESGCAGECGGGKNKTLFSYFTSSMHPDGPWSPLRNLCATQEAGDASCLNWTFPAPKTVGTDMNLAPVIRADGSAIAWTRWNIWEASDWKDPSTYKDTGQAPDFNDGYTGWEGEDPSMWRDKDGHYHIVSHNGARGVDHLPTNSTGDCGRHYFSEKGLAGTWHVAPLPRFDLGGCAFPRVDVPFADGKNYTFYRRERPHIVLGPDGYTPVALTTAVIDSPLGPGVAGFTGNQRDASYTLLQPIVGH